MALYDFELARRGRRARKFLAKRTSANQEYPYYQFNGERIVGFQCDQKLPIFSGSSINRRINDKRKKDLQECKKETQKMPKNAYAIPGLWEKSAAGNICDAKAGMYADEKKLAGSIDGKANRIHVFSARSKQKVRDKTNAFFRKNRWGCTFVTLTFINAIDDISAMKLLNKFFTQVRKDQGKFAYLWVAERQEKNETFPDNIHFHIVIDRRLDLFRYNSVWVLQQYRAGLRVDSLGLDEVESIHENTMRLLNEKKKIQAMKLSVFDKVDRLKNINDEIKATMIGRHLNPFDIKKITTHNGLSQYLTKYVTKNEGGFKCRPWHCSKEVSAYFTKALVSLELFNEAGTVEKNPAVDKETGEVVPPNTIRPSHGYCVIRFIYFNKKYFSEKLAVMDQVNRWVQSDGFNPDIPEYDWPDYLRNIFNRRDSDGFIGDVTDRRERN